MDQFSLTAGGPFHTLLVRLSRTKRPTRKGNPFARSAFLAALVSWGPLLALSWMQGLALGETGLPFLRNYPEHVRFLVAVPLLILAEATLGARLNQVVRHFRGEDMVALEDSPRLEAALELVRKGRDSMLAELVLLALAFVLSGTGQVVARRGITRDWLYAPGTAEAWHSLAGLWFFWFSMPLYLFLLFRWLWRLFLWAAFLRRVARLRLQLVPTHPDHFGGLEIVGRAQTAFLAVSFPAASVVASTLHQRSRILGDVSPTPVVVLFVSLCLLLFLGPLLFFTPVLLQARRRGLIRYGKFASDYVRAFDEKWIQAKSDAPSSSLGSSDIQSLADLGNSYTLVTEMRLFPLERRLFLAFAIFTALPFAPLVLLRVPMPELLKMLAGMLIGR